MPPVKALIFDAYGTEVFGMRAPQRQGARKVRRPVYAIRGLG